MKRGLSIVIPTYKENKNIKKLIKLVYKKINLKFQNFEVIIVDDNSKDGIEINYKKLKEKFFNLKLLVRKSYKKDLSKSCIMGFSKSRYSNILVMDADLQHHPKYINLMLNNFIKNNFDILVACRKFKYQSKVGLSNFRYFSSKVIIFIFNFFLGFKTNDPMSGFFIFKKKIFIKNNNRLFGRGYKILADLIYNSKDDLKIEDIFIDFQKRLVEKSKMNYKIVILLFIFLIKKILSKKELN